MRLRVRCRGHAARLYRSAEDHVHELWWDGSWHNADLTAVTGSPPAWNQPDPHGYMFDAQRTQHVVYIGREQHVHELVWDGNWHHTDLSLEAGAPPAEGGPPGYAFEAELTQHVLYRGSDRHVHELTWRA
jgi:hypothetical protein